MNSVNTRGSSHPKEEIFEVDGMDCSEEVAAIERALKPVPGVVTVRAEIVSSKVTVSHDGRPNRAELTAAINQAGVTVRNSDDAANRPWLRPALVAMSGLTTGIGLLLQWIGFGGEWLPDAAFLFAILTGGALVLPKALRSLRTFTLDINVLMVVAVAGAVVIGGLGVSPRTDPTAAQFGLRRRVAAFSPARHVSPQPKRCRATALQNATIRGTDP